MDDATPPGHLAPFVEVIASLSHEAFSLLPSLGPHPDQETVL